MIEKKTNRKKGRLYPMDGEQYVELLIGVPNL